MLCKFDRCRQIEGLIKENCIFAVSTGTHMITDKETNKVYFSLRLTWYKAWPGIKAALDAADVKYSLLEGTRDIWMRDYMPVQLDVNSFVSFVYNPDYLQEEKKRITDWTKIRDLLPIENHPTKLILDGGNVIKCRDFVLMTDKVFLENRRQGLSRFEVMEELERLFGNVVILPWNISDKWDFCGHADGMVRCIEGNRVLLNNICNHPEAAWQYKEIKKILKDRGVDFMELDYGQGYHGINDWVYINFLRVGDNIFMPTVENAETDNLAAEQLRKVYGCEVTPIPLLSIVKANGRYGGGALNCLSWTVRE